MQRTMTDVELSVYTRHIKNPSEDFSSFVHDYITGSTWIRSRGEEDVSIWSKLKGEELKIAKQIILDELQTILDPSYIRAVGFFRDDKAIPILKSIIETCPEKFVAEKLLAAKVLYDWFGYDDYISMLITACKSGDEIVYNYFKYSINQFISGLSEIDKAKVMHSLERK